MLGEDDFLEIVLDPATDPGADKRGTLRSGQVLSAIFVLGEDTGGACFAQLPGNRRRAAKQDVTHLGYTDAV